MMSDYTRKTGLLPLQEIEYLQQNVPTQILANQKAFANGMDFLSWHDFLEMFSPEDALDE